MGKFIDNIERVAERLVVQKSVRDFFAKTRVFNNRKREFQ